MGLCRDYGTAPRSLLLHIYCYEKIEKRISSFTPSAQRTIKINYRLTP